MRATGPSTFPARLAVLLGLGLAAATAVTLLPPHAAQGQSPDARPNIVVIMTDDQTVAELSGMQNTLGLIGGQGVRFRRSYVSYPVCCPSRATYLTGQYAHNHHVMGLYPPTGGYGRFDKRERPPGLAAEGRATTRPSRQVPQRLRRPGAGRRAAGMERLARDGRLLDLPHVGLHDERQRPVPYVRPAVRRRPALLPDGRADRARRCR